MIRFLFFILTVTFCSHFSQAQGIITITEEEKISELMGQFVELNKAVQFIEGWRIQLIATTDRQRMESALSRFQTLYPNIFVDWTHAKPYYKLRAGAFANKLEAVRLLHVLKIDYPTAYPARDNTIRPAELIPGL